MKLATALAAAALGLAACAQENGNNAASDDFVVDEAADPATANLTVNSDPSAVDPAVNQTDQQSDLGNAAENAVSDAGNAVE